MAAIDDLNLAAAYLQDAIYNLEVRLAAYAPGTYDAEMGAVTVTVQALTTTVNELAPTPEARALELKAVG